MFDLANSNHATSISATALTLKLHARVNSNSNAKAATLARNGLIELRFVVVCIYWYILYNARAFHKLVERSSAKFRHVWMVEYTLQPPISLQ
jgi:hypothetical protein